MENVEIVNHLAKYFKVFYGSVRDSIRFLWKWIYFSNSSNKSNEYFTSSIFRRTSIFVSNLAKVCGRWKIVNRFVSSFEVSVIRLLPCMVMKWCSVDPYLFIKWNIKAHAHNDDKWTLNIFLSMKETINWQNTNTQWMNRNRNVREKILI